MRPKLQYFSRDPAVRELQQKLNQIMKTVLPPLVVDGIFGDRTLQRVQQFQRSRGLVPDGIVGVKTWAALDGNAPAKGHPSSPTGDSTPVNPLRPVMRIQNYAMIRCNYGLVPSPLIIYPPDREANIRDCVPYANILPFGRCRSLNNPETREINEMASEALGRLDGSYDDSDSDKSGTMPGPCKPSFDTNCWCGTKQTDQVGTPPAPALDTGCHLNCVWGGKIRFR